MDKIVDMDKKRKSCLIHERMKKWGAVAFSVAATALAIYVWYGDETAGFFRGGRKTTSRIA